MHLHVVTYLLVQSVRPSCRKSITLTATDLETDKRRVISFEQVSLTSPAARAATNMKLILASEYFS